MDWLLLLILWLLVQIGVLALVPCLNLPFTLLLFVIRKPGSISYTLIHRFSSLICISSSIYIVAIVRFRAGLWTWLLLLEISGQYSSRSTTTVPSPDRSSTTSTAIAWHLPIIPSTSKTKSKSTTSPTSYSVSSATSKTLSILRRPVLRIRLLDVIQAGHKTCLFECLQLEPLVRLRLLLFFISRPLLLVIHCVELSVKFGTELLSWILWSVSLSQVLHF